MPGWKDKPTSPWRMSGQLTNRRRQYFVVLGIVVFVMFVLYHPSKVTHSAKFAGGLSREDSTKKTEWENPPTLAKLKKWQENLPQHNLSLPYPEGRTGRYVKFSNQVKRLGWNNAFNEILMNTHLAYESKRAYVFQPYIWKESHYAWPEHKMREIPPSTPLPAIISGPSAGGPWDEGDDAPRSVSEEWFEVVCPKNERTIINTRDVKPNIGWADGVEIFNHWKKILLDSQDRCIEIEPEHYTKDFFPQTFDLWLWGSTRVRSLWPIFAHSPTSRLLEPSHIVKSAVDRNEYLFIPHGPRPKVAVSRSSYDRMLAVHVRRGDFKESCLHLAKYNSTFYSWNLLEDLPDSFTPPPGGEPEKNTPENIEKYLEHCLPSAEDMVRKVRESRYEYLDISKKGHRVLDVLFLLTNEQGEWLEQLKKTFKQDGWHTIVTSKDLELDQEQTEVNMAVDMEIARRAAVFIGNGWSSFTSNIVHKRLVDGKEYFPQSLGVKTPDTVPFIPNPQILATHFMDYDRKSAVSSFYGRKNSMDALNRDFPGPSSSSQRPRDDASSFFNPDAPRSSMDPLNGRPSAGYNRGSYFNAGRAEPVRGGRDEEEAGEKVGEHIWDVYADFNNAGPRYSTNLGQQSSKGYEPLPPSTPLKDDDAASSRNPVEMVTVPALGAEWGREELKDMTKASRKAKKAEARRAQITAFNRGERGLCGKWLTRKTLVFTLFILCAIAAIVLGFTIPRVPSFSFNSEKPLIQASGDWNKTIPTYFNRAPANFSFPAFASLKVDTSSNYLPLKFNSLEAKVYDLDSLRLVGEGELQKLTLPKGFPAIQLPLNITYLGENSSDVTWASWYNACKNKGQYPNGLRPPLKFRLVLDMNIFGLPGKRATSTQISDAPCPIELDQSSA